MTKHHVALTVLFVLLMGVGLFFAKTTSEKATVTFTTGSADNAKVSPTPAMIELSGGLKVQDIVVGTGTQAEAGDTVAAHYVGTLANGRKFDSSYDRGEPFEFVLGGGQVIRGWDIGIVGMRVGGKRKLVIPPALGYGNREVGNGAIPANSTLIFEVELVAVKQSGK